MTMNARNFLSRSAILSVLLLSFSSHGIAQNLSLKKNQIFKISSALTCGFVAGKNKWLPIKKVKLNYVLNSKASSGQKSSCDKLLKPSKSLSLTKIPDTTKILKSVANASSRGIHMSAVSGTPPTLPEISALDTSTLFWRSGVVDAIGTGSPSQEQCSEFFNGQSDGQSGGFSACYMTEGIGYSMGSIAQSGTSLCYMKNFPTTANKNAGAVSVTSGSLPGNKMENIFSTPLGGTARLVKVRADSGGEANTIFIKVYSENENVEQGNQYRYDIWFCEDGDTRPQEFEQTKISAGGELITTAIHSSGDGGTGFSTVKGFLKARGSSLTYDNSKVRTALYGHVQEGERPSNFKSSVVVNADNEIRTKIRDRQGEQPARKGYSVARFLGSTIGDLRFLEGAYKESNEQFSFSGATEYRDSLFVSAPSSAYINELSGVNFTSDSFYDSQVSLPGTLSASCSARADIVLALDMTHEAMAPVQETCEGFRMDNLKFCQSESLSAAQERWQSVCGG